MWTCRYKATKEAINSIDINQILQYFKLNQFFKSSNEIDRHHISKFFSKIIATIWMCTYIEDRKIYNTLTFNFKLNFRILETKVDILLLKPI